MTSDELTCEYTGAFGNRSGPRSRNGCRTCRQKKVKCDETRPICHRCARLCRVCDWTLPPRKRPSKTENGKARRMQQAVSPSPQPVPPVPRSPPVQRSTDLEVRVEEDEDEADERDDEALILVDPAFLVTFGETKVSPEGVSLRSLIPASGTSSSGLMMDNQSHAAVFMYATRFAASVDTKHTSYSVPAVVLQTAATEPAVMHMILAIGRQHLAVDAPKHDMPDERAVHAVTALEHYGQALSLLGNILLRCTTTRTLDVILATLWLTTIYEQRFGQRPMRAITTHLQGAVSVLISANVTRVIQQHEDDENEPPVSRRDGIDLSYFGARLLVWLLGLDARATTFGHGGALNSALGLHFGGLGPRHDCFRALSVLYQRSAPLFQTTWGPEYPMREILYDVKHKGIFDLFRDCAQLRLMATEVRRAEDADTRDAKETAAQRKLDALRKEHIDLFSMAAGLSASSVELEPELTLTLCWVMPHYYASVLDILRASGRSDTEHSETLEAVQMILRLALQGYRKEGAQAIVRVAWPLLMAGMEAQDPFQQQWAIDRLKELAPFGKCYHPAALLLEKMQSQSRSGGPCAAESMEALYSGNFFI